MVTLLPVALKLVPVMVMTSDPARLSVVGLMPLTIGAGLIYWKPFEDCPQMVTTTFPVHGIPAGTVATIDVCDWEVKAVTTTPPMVTVLPVDAKLVPEIVIVLPDVSTDGLMLVIAGAVTV